MGVKFSQIVLGNTLQSTDKVLAVRNITGSPQDVLVDAPVYSLTAGTGLTGGTITTSGTIALDLTSANTWTGQQTFTATNASTIASIIKGFASQTADLLQLQNSSGTVLSKFDAAGLLTTPNINITSITQQSASSAYSGIVIDTATGQLRTSPATSGLQPVIDNTLSAPPSSPNVGDSYIVAATGSGAWAGKTSSIATWGGSSWTFYTPATNDQTTVLTGTNAGKTYVWNGSAWVQTSITTSNWMLNGNTNGSLKTLGTLDAYDLPFITGGVEAARLTTANRTFLVGTTTDNVIARSEIVKTNVQLRLGAGTTNDGLFLGGRSSTVCAIGTSYYNGTNYTAQATSAAVLELSSGAHLFYNNSGLTAGSAYTATESFRLNVNKTASFNNAITSPVADYQFQHLGNGSTSSNTLAIFKNDSSGIGSTLNFYYSSGTYSSPVALTGVPKIGGINFYGYISSGYASLASIEGYRSSGDASALYFNVANSGTSAESLRIEGNTNGTRIFINKPNSALIAAFNVAGVISAQATGAFSNSSSSGWSFALYDNASTPVNKANMGWGNSSHTFASSLGFLTTSTDPITFWTNNTKRMTLSSNGTLMVNTATDNNVARIESVNASTKPQARFGTSTTNDGLFVSARAADSGTIGTAYYNGTNYTPRNTTATLFDQAAGVFTWYSDTSLTAGIAYTPTSIATLSASGFGINVSSINNSAVLQADSTTKGFLPPRMTTTQKTSISSPAIGLVVYDTTLNKLCVYTGSAWETVTSL